MQLCKQTTSIPYPQQTHFVGKAINKTCFSFVGLIDRQLSQHLVRVSLWTTVRASCTHVNLGPITSFALLSLMKGRFSEVYHIF
jgi:hypothetical protein